MQHWLRGGVEDERERIADLMRFGVSEAEAKAFVSDDAPRPAVFGVWAGNAEVLQVFFRLKRQWRLHPFNGKPVGLDHTAIPPTLQLMGIPRRKWPGLFDQLAVCENTVLEGRG